MHMNHIKLIDLFMLKLCYLNGWKIIMQLNYIKCKFRPNHVFECASPQISTKKRRAPQPPKTAGSALPPPPVRALRPLPQRQGPNPPPSAVGEPKTTDNSSQ